MDFHQMWKEESWMLVVRSWWEDKGIYCHVCSCSRGRKRVGFFSNSILLLRRAWLSVLVQQTFWLDPKISFAAFFSHFASVRFLAGNVSTPKFNLVRWQSTFIFRFKTSVFLRRIPNGIDPMVRYLLNQMVVWSARRDEVNAVAAARARTHSLLGKGYRHTVVECLLWLLLNSQFCFFF